MDVPERDKVFSKLLARSLRQSLELGGADCPGSEILAAYSEHALSNSETSHWERHFSNCSRCQQTLAAQRLAAGGPPKTPIKTPSPSEPATRPAKARPAAGDEANQGALEENAGATAGKFYRDRQTVSAGAAGGRESAKAADTQAEAPAIAAALEPSATRAESSQAIAERKDKANQEPAARALHSVRIPAPQPAAPSAQTVVVTQEAVKTEQDKSSKEQSGRTVFDATPSVPSESKAKESSEIASDSQTRRMTEVLRKPSVAVK